MIVKGREIIPPLNYFPYSFLFPLFSYYSYSSFFFLPFRTRPLPLRSPSSFPHLHPYSSSSSLRSSSRFTFQSHSALPYTLPFLILQSHLTSLFFDLTPFFLTLRFHLTSLLSDLLSTCICSPTSDLTSYPPYFPIVLHHLLTLQSHPIPSPNSKIRILLRRPPPISVQLKL